MFLRKRRGIFGCTVFIAQPMWDFLRRRRQETGSSFLLSESVSVVFVVFLFFCINVLSLLDYPAYGGFLCRVSMSESS